MKMSHYRLHRPGACGTTTSWYAQDALRRCHKEAARVKRWAQRDYRARLISAEIFYTNSTGTSRRDVPTFQSIGVADYVCVGRSLRHAERAAFAAAAVGTLDASSTSVPSDRCEVAGNGDLAEYRESGTREERG